jgi:hypothetical protein
MPTNYPVEDVEAALKTIFEGIVSGPLYFNTVKKVSRVFKLPEDTTEGERPFIVITDHEPETTETESVGASAARLRRAIPINVGGYFEIPSGQEPQTVANQLVHDIVTAVMKNRNPTQNGSPSLYIGEIHRIYNEVEPVGVVHVQIICDFDIREDTL